MDIKEKEAQIYATEGYKIHTIMRALDMSLQIFKKNYQEFNDLIKMFENPSYNLFFWADGKESEIIRINFQVEVYRTFTNFVSSASSLIDHSRNIVKKDIKDIIKDKYENKKNEYFVNNELASFIKDLRNYLLHREYPNIKITTHLHNSNNEFTIETGELTKWTRWSSVSKAFLAGQIENISIVSVVENYYKLVVEFYEWFFNELRTAYKKEYDEVNNLIQQFNTTFWS